ncbi:MAG: SoxR reducing system RseC family protein [Spirochaetes bacterium]|nr:SoxR reducing system RseC family protein [Spirochaetota bacterium]
MEHGNVIEVSGDRILVEAEPNECCSGCPAGASCAIGSGGKKRVIWMRNTLRAAVGDGVVFRVDASSVIFGSALIYFFPVAMLLSGLVFGAAGPGFPGLGREASSIAWGAAGLIMSCAVIGIVSAVTKRRGLFAPVLIDVEKKKMN